jgi:hypothetical protein
MLKTLKFPWLYIIELVLWLPLLAGFATTVAFVAAKPIASLDLQGRSLPVTWEAAVANHGKFLEGYLIAKHPAAFAFGVLLLLGAAALLYPVYKAQLWQRQSDGESRLAAHKIAHVCVAAALVALGYFLLNHYLVGVSPA